MATGKGKLRVKVQWLKGNGIRNYGLNGIKSETKGKRALESGDNGIRSYVLRGIESEPRGLKASHQNLGDKGHCN